MDSIGEAFLVIFGLVALLGLTAIISGIAALIVSGTAKIVAASIFGVSLSLFLIPVITVSWYSSDSYVENSYKQAEKNRYRNATPLIIAVRKNNIKKVQNLLKKGADPNETSILHDYRKDITTSPLLEACSKIKEPFNDLDIEKSDKILKMLLDAGANPNTDLPTSYWADPHPEQKYTEYRTPLLAAIEGHREKAVNILIEKGAVIDSWDESTKTFYKTMPLQCALEKSYSISVLLLEKGAKSDEYLHSKYKNDKGNTLLMQAVNYPVSESENNFELINSLIQRWNNINAKNTEEFTAFRFWAEKYVCDRYYDWENQQKKYLPMAEKLLSLGADINSQDNKGITPLMRCTDANYFNFDMICNIAEFFASHGADVSLKDEYGQTALDRFVICVNELIKYSWKTEEVWFSKPEHSRTDYNKIIKLLTPKKTKNKTSSLQAKSAEQSESAKIARVSDGHTELNDMTDNW